MNDHLHPETIIPELLENDSKMLVLAPTIWRELRQQPEITPEDFYQVLVLSLAKGQTPAEWLKELVKSGQIALARRLFRQSRSIAPSALKQVSDRWKERSDNQINAVRQRLEHQSSVLENSVEQELQGFLEKAEAMAEEFWFDLALEHVVQIDRVLDMQVAEATKERELRYEKAQEVISASRRAMLQAELQMRSLNNREG